MKIFRIEQYRLRHRCQLVKVTTDSGVVGWGETTLEGKLGSAWAAVVELADYLVGRDPLRVEHHWQSMYRSAFNRGGVQNMAAISGIEQALYDIAGKHFGVPSYWLLGGPTRDRIKVYAHCGLGDFARMDRLVGEKGYQAFNSSLTTIVSLDISGTRTPNIVTYAELNIIASSRLWKSASSPSNRLCNSKVPLIKRTAPGPTPNDLAAVSSAATTS